PVQYDEILLGAGMDEVTPALSLSPGRCRRMVNYECSINGGYRRVEGYERYDGQTSPSSVTFRLVPIAVFSTTPAAGQILTGSTSGTTATIIAVGTNYLAVTGVLGTGFQEGEIVLVSGVII